jgi:hypothetical protein
MDFTFEQIFSFSTQQLHKLAKALYKDTTEHISSRSQILENFITLAFNNDDLTDKDTQLIESVISVNLADYENAVTEATTAAEFRQLLKKKIVKEKKVPKSTKSSPTKSSPTKSSPTKSPHVSPTKSPRKTRVLQAQMPNKKYFLNVNGEDVEVAPFKYYYIAESMGDRNETHEISIGTELKYGNKHLELHAGVNRRNKIIYFWYDPSTGIMYSTNKDTKNGEDKNTVGEKLLKADSPKIENSTIDQ